ncbi:hypothetical protein ACN6LI_002213, partial [Streptomyces violaceoruber]
MVSSAARPPGEQGKGAGEVPQFVLGQGQTGVAYACGCPAGPEDVAAVIAMTAISVPEVAATRVT